MEGESGWRPTAYGDQTQRPEGEIADGVLSLNDEAVPEPSDGQFLLQLNYLSLDPTNRAWMNPEETHMPPVELGDPMRGIVCGTMVESRHPESAKGDVVSGLGAWAEYQLGTPEALNTLEPGPIPLADAFGIFTVVGPTAYFGLLNIGQPKAGETVVVSAAAGATGSIVGQITKIKGCRVVGLAGKVTSLMTVCSWRFISVNAFCIRWIPAAASSTRVSRWRSRVRMAVMAAVGAQRRPCRGLQRHGVGGDRRPGTRRDATDQHP